MNDRIELLSSENAEKQGNEGAADTTNSLLQKFKVESQKSKLQLKETIKSIQGNVGLH